MARLNIRLFAVRVRGTNSLVAAINCVETETALNTASNWSKIDKDYLEVSDVGSCNDVPVAMVDLVGQL